MHVTCVYVRACVLMAPADIFLIGLGGESFKLAVKWPSGFFIRMFMSVQFHFNAKKLSSVDIALFKLALSD